MSDELIHYGVKGMKWGVRKAEETGGYRAQLSAVNIDPTIHKATKEAAIEVSNLISDRYGFNIRNIKELGKDHPEYPDTAAYVAINKGSVEGTIHIQARDLRKHMSDTEKTGWMAPGTGNVRGLLTHESAHAFFHATQTVKSGFSGPKVVGGNIKARDKALQVAIKTSMQDGHNLYDTSGYVRHARMREELEAELFSQYHWAHNPPRYVKAWGETLHKELGVDPTPFKEVK
ncbi:hypothetical protein SEA_FRODOSWAGGINS_10 [Streptomyces phage FrodoSwaggins]|uniref:Peptidase n=3 Tax=Rimavirus drgrey TaxID=2560783 RepID=A0A649VV87_9CAUD|nr:hypothetical protein FDI43_gp10 [Streptomyces phage DrGrey]ASU03995.1 hypothetical protein SEA_DRGREY_10 [Streptomyces phage DrGrey]QAY17044.1 hypothetical protein SEA_POPY_10 [Streptomyces phage Popy]QGJ96550.1 hypothetical protein SEA_FRODOSWAGGINS_10 [Streptomyces phage FrodoSwaggins]